MMMRSLLLATALLALDATTAFAQDAEAIAAPVLRARVAVSADVVRIGDVVDNAGPAGSIAIYRAPDLGMTGTLPVAQVLAALRARQVIGVDARDIQEVAVTRLARTFSVKEIEQQVARAIEHRGGLGDAANISLTFDRDLQDIRLDAANTGALQAVGARYDSRSSRFDVAFEIAGGGGSAPTRLRFTGSAIETVEAAVVMRDIDRGDVLKSSDVVTERRPKADVSGEAANRDKAVGMQVRRPIRAGQALKTTDLARPDLVQRDQGVTLVYEAPGLYLTIRGKALDNGTEGDVVNVLNLQSKRTVAGVVIGRGQVAIQAVTPRAAPEATASIAPEPAAVSVASSSSSVTPKAE